MNRSEEHLDALEGKVRQNWNAAVVLLGTGLGRLRSIHREDRAGNMRPALHCCFWPWR